MVSKLVLISIAHSRKDCHPHCVFYFLVPLIPTIIQRPMTCMPLLGKCHDDQQKGQNQFGCGRTLWAMKTTYECLLMYGAHNREIKCSHQNHTFDTSKFLIRVASLKRPQWPTTYWYVGLNGWSWLRCRAPGILLEVVTTTRIKRCGRRNVQSSLAPMSWHSIRFEFQKQFSEMSSMHQTDMEDWLYKASWMRQISCKLTCPLACLIALQSTA